MQTIEYLNPDNLILTRRNGGLLSAKMDDQVYEEVSIYRTFPRKHPFQYLSLRDKKDQELGIILDLAELNQQSEQEAKLELRTRYLVPKVLKVLSVKQEPGIWTLKFLTDRGEVEFFVRNVHDHIKMSDSGRVMIKEHDSRQVYIEQFNQLDKKSIRLFNKIL